MVPVISVRVAGVPAAAGAAAGVAEEAAGEGVEADVTLPSGRPQEGLTMTVLTHNDHALRNSNY